MFWKISPLKFGLVSVCICLTGSCGPSSPAGGGSGGGPRGPDSSHMQAFLINTDIGTYTPTRGRVATPDTLTCSIRADELCNWRNAESPDDDFDWVRARFRDTISPEMFRAATEKQVGPVGDFLMVGEPSGRAAPDSAALVADVAGQLGDGHLSFDYWASSDRPQLWVCIIGIFDRQCQGPVNRGVPNPLTFVIPGSPEPFQIRLEANSFAFPDLIMIDNLHYSADMNERVGDSIINNNADGKITTSTVSNDVTAARQTLTDVPAVENVNCKILQCDFDGGTPCAYNVVGTGSQNGMWNIGAGKIGNPATGINRPNPNSARDLGYAYIGRDAKLPENAVYVLESPAFEIGDPVVLKFDLYQRSVGPIMEVCIDDTNNCPYVNPDLDANRFWYTDQEVRIPAGKHRVLFVGRNLRSNLFVAIDNVHLVSVDGSASVCTPVGKPLDPFIR